jgi:hypothetical protein
MASKFEGIEKMQRRVAAMPRALVRNVEPALREGAGDIAAMARRLVPMRTGKLRDSIQVAPGAHELQYLVLAGNKRAWYARLVERSRKGHPYLGPSYRALLRSVKRRINRAAREGIKEATRV